MTPHSPEACARAGIPYTPGWRERYGSPIYGSISPMEYAEMHGEPTGELEEAAVWRALHRGSREKGLVRVGTAEYSEAWWKHEWRSMPGYDGGGNALSGPRWVRDAVTGLLADEPMCVACAPTATVRHIEGLEPSQAPDNARKDEHDVVQYARWCVENFHGWPASDGCFVHPSKSGRGWCRKLAGVE